MVRLLLLVPTPIRPHPGFVGEPVRHEMIASYSGDPTTASDILTPNPKQNVYPSPSRHNHDDVLSAGDGQHVRQTTACCALTWKRKEEPHGKGGSDVCMLICCLPFVIFTTYHAHVSNGAWILIQKRVTASIWALLLFYVHRGRHMLPTTAIVLALCPQNCCAARRTLNNQYSSL